MLTLDPTAPLRNPAAALHTLTENAYKTARDKGWPSHAGDGIPVALLLIHDEISESEEAVSRSAYVGELADVVVRCLDLAACVDADLWYAALTELLHGESPQQATPGLLAILAPAPCSSAMLPSVRLHLHVSRLARLFRRTPEHTDEMPPTFFMELALLVRLAARTIMQSGEDPDTVILDVMHANTFRAARHGGKRI